MKKEYKIVAIIAAIVVAVIVIAGLAGMFGSDDPTNQIEVSSQSTTWEAATEKASHAQSQTEEAGIETSTELKQASDSRDVGINKVADETKAPAVKPQQTGNGVQNGATTGESNALRSAKNYLSIMAFSYDGLIGQLEYEGFSNAEAVYGADHCGADWNEQAVKSAKNYLATMAFSYSGLIGQLEYEGFTTSQATYGADQCGADWNEQAAKCAKNYLDTMAFSRDGLIGQLEYEGFTHEQAVYGAQANGY